MELAIARVTCGRNFALNSKLEKRRSMGSEGMEHRPQITFQRSVLPRIERQKVVCTVRVPPSFPFSSLLSFACLLLFSNGVLPALFFHELSSIFLSVSGPIDRAAWERTHGEKRISFSQRYFIKARYHFCVYYSRSHNS